MQLRFFQPLGTSVTVHNITHPRPKQAMGPILAGIGVAIGLAAPWGGVADHKATLTNLIKSIAALAQDPGDTLQSLQQPLDSLANVVFDNQPALDY